MKIIRTNIGNNLDLSTLAEQANEYASIQDVRIITTKEIEDYLKEHPTHYAYDGDDTFLALISNKVVEVVTSDNISRHKLVKANVDKEWVIVEPVSFIHAVKAWDCGSHILKRSDDLCPCTTYVQDSKLDRDDISFDAIDILVYAWFKYISK